MKILVATEKPFAPAAIEQIRAVAWAEDHELIMLENYKSESEFLSAVSDADALIVRSDLVTPAVLDAARKLNCGKSRAVDNIDDAAAHGVVAMNTPGQNSNAVAELVFLMMLYQARGGFTGSTGTELRGKTLGIHAFGNVGRYVAEISRGFGMITYAFDPFVSDIAITGLGAKVCRKVEELYSNCQYVSLHMPANNETIRSIGYKLLSRMPYNAVLINTARKEIINEDDLLKTFKERTDFKYLADFEPDCRPVLEEKYKGRFLIPDIKMGAQTKEANMNAGIAAARQIVSYFKTGDEKFRVNK
jgi:D-3-phosphoglycerate dehydrogenase